MRCNICDIPCEKNNDTVYNIVTHKFDTICGVCRAASKDDDFFIDNDDTGVPHWSGDNWRTQL